MRYHDLIVERYVNLHSDAEKAKYADEVYQLIDKAYGYIGGHLNYPSPDKMIHSDEWWKLVRKGGVIVAVAIYKNASGAKRVAFADDGTRVAKMELMKLVAADIKQSRGWSEVSGKAANLCIRLGLPPVPNEYAGDLLGKDIIATHGRFKYDRLINGNPYTKMIVGFPHGQRFEVSNIDSSEVVFEI